MSRKRKASQTVEQHQDIQKLDRQGVRTKLREHVEALEENQQSLMRPLREQQAALTRALDLEHEVVTGARAIHAQELVYDSQFLRKAGEIAVENASRIEASVRESPAMVVAGIHKALLGYVAEDEEGAYEDAEAERWSRLGQLVFSRGYLKSVPGPAFLAGAIPAEQKAPKERKRKVVEEPAAPKRTVAKLKEKDVGGKSEWTKGVVKMRRYLKQKKAPVPFWNLGVVPEDIGKTVENVFHLSFLVRDGKAGVQGSNEDGSALIKATKPPDQGQVPQKRQAIIRIDASMLNKAMELYDIREELVPETQE